MSIVVILSLVAGRAMLGPIRVDFLRPIMERSLNAQLDGQTVEFAHTVVVWGGWRRALDIRVTDVALKDSQGLPVVTLPQVAVGINPVAMLTGNFSPRRIDLFSPTIQLSRRADGSFGFRRDNRVSEDSELVRQLLEKVLAAPSGNDELRRLVIEDALLDIDDLAHEENWRVVGTTLDIRRTNDGARATLTGTLKGVQRQTSFDLRADFDRASGRIDVTLDVAGARPAMFARPTGTLTVLRGWDLPVSGKVSMTARTDGTIGRVDFSLTADKGTIAIPALAGPVAVTGAVLKGNLDRQSGRLTFAPMQLAVAGGAIEGKGVLFTGTSGQGGEVDVTIRDIPFATVAALWPTGVKTNTRGWFERNVKAGNITVGTVRVQAEPTVAEAPPRVDFSLGFEYEGMEAHYLRPVPPITEGVGRASLTPSAFELWVDRGRIVDPATDMDIDVVGLYGLIDNLDQPTVHEADITLAAAMSVPELLTLLDYKPLGYTTAFGVRPQALGGNARVKARFRIPLITKLTMRDVQYGAWLTAEEFLLREGFDDWEPAPGTLALVLDPSGVRANGQLSFLGQPVEVDWTERFGVRDGTPTLYRGRAMVPAELLRRKGLPEAVEMTGAARVEVELAGKGTKITQGTLVADLSGAAVGFPLLEWSKPAGEPGTLTAAMATETGGLRPNAFTLTMPDLDMAGRLSFTDTGAFAAADLSRFKVLETDISVVATQPANEPLDLKLSGRQIDLRPFLEGDEDEGAGAQEEAEEEPSDFAATASVDVDTAIAPKGVPIRDMDATLRIAEGELVDGRIHGILRSGKPVSIDYSLQGDKPGLDVKTEDGGELLRTLGMLNGVTGGQLSLSARISGPRGKRHTVGLITARDFRIKDSPMMAQLLTLGSLSGLRDILTGDGIGFDRFEVDFDLGEGTLLLKDGRGMGSQLGVRMSGRLYDGQKKLDIQGTLAPAYTLNTVLDYVPVVGSMLSGGENEGLIAIRFSVGGTTDKPDVSVNPLSALTPGFLRGIFDVFSPGGKKPEKPSTP